MSTEQQCRVCRYVFAGWRTHCPDCGARVITAAMSAAPPAGAKCSDASFIDMVAYFWREKGDPTRYVEWNEQRCRDLMPDFHFAWRTYEMARVALNTIAEETS